MTPSKASQMGTAAREAPATKPNLKDQAPTPSEARDELRRTEDVTLQETQHPGAGLGEADKEQAHRVCRIIKGDCQGCPASELIDGESYVRGCFAVAVECINVVETGNPWRRTDNVKPPWTIFLPKPHFQAAEARAISAEQALVVAGEALEPFGREASIWGDLVPDEHHPLCVEMGQTNGDYYGSDAVYTVGDLRRASTVYADIQKGLGLIGSPAEAPQWRPEVRAFADLMEAKLRANDHKGGWKREPAHVLLQRLGEEFRELTHELNSEREHDWEPWDPISDADKVRWRQAVRLKDINDFSSGFETRPIGGVTNRLHPTPEWTAKLGGEAADVANFAMMIADVCGSLGPFPASPSLATGAAPTSEGGEA